MGPGPGGGRMPGPPPPYPAGRGQHPGPGVSPNPHSPATSLPMSSPGAGMINSPRPMGSNPGTPVSGPPMSSPVLGSKNSPGGGSNAQHGMSGQDPYGIPGNRMHNFKNSCSKEANLMPVPSPQQIQFPLLDGQELTIQKQPNTSLRDSDLVSPSVGQDPSTPNPSDGKGPGTPGPHTPGSQLGDAPPKYPGGPQTPHTPSSQDKSSRFPVPSPGPSDPRFPVPASPSQGRFQGGMSPSQLGLGPDNSSNMPLNPATPSSTGNNPCSMAGKAFDPISSMAQMSQQLTGQVSTPCSTPNSIGQGPDSGLGS